MALGYNNESSDEEEHGDGEHRDGHDSDWD
jgi:hypothetical protein